MLRRAPESVNREGRFLFVRLQLNNTGFGHLNDMRKLAKKMNKDPDRWLDIEKIFSLLSQKIYYKFLKCGYARGTEPVR